RRHTRFSRDWSSDVCSSDLRLGWDYDSINIQEVAERLQETGIKALSIHGRTRSQMYKGEADWTEIAKVKANPNIEIPIFGNGDRSEERRVGKAGRWRSMSVR